MKRLIVNADDLGMSDGVNRGILEAHEDGIVTSTSLMVERPAAVAGAGLARDTGLSVGLHIVLDSRGELLVPPEEAPRELERQLARFEELAGRAPTHVDSHHHIHRDPRVLPAFVAFAERHGLPLRDHSRARHRPMFYGRWDNASHPEQVSVDTMLGILAGIGDGVTELGCHPGYAAGLASRYSHERELELRTLVDPRVRGRAAELQIELIGFHQL